MVEKFSTKNASRQLSLYVFICYITNYLFNCFIKMFIILNATSVVTKKKKIYNIKENFYLVLVLFEECIF